MALQVNDKPRNNTCLGFLLYTVTYLSEQMGYTLKALTVEAASGKLCVKH
jgi:hypothetical protein